MSNEQWVNHPIWADNSSLSDLCLVSGSSNDCRLHFRMLKNRFWVTAINWLKIVNSYDGSVSVVICKCALCETVIHIEMNIHILESSTSFHHHLQKIFPVSILFIFIHQSICAISLPNLSTISFYLFFSLACNSSVWYCHSHSLLPLNPFGNFKIRVFEYYRSRARYFHRHMKILWFLARKQHDKTQHY